MPTTDRRILNPSLDSILDEWMDHQPDSYDSDLPCIVVIEGQIGVWFPHLDGRDAIVGGHFEAAPTIVQLAHQARCEAEARASLAMAAALSDEEPF